jgi:hypothetical protein
MRSIIKKIYNYMTQNENEKDEKGQEEVLTYDGEMAVVEILVETPTHDEAGNANGSLAVGTFHEVPLPVAETLVSSGHAKIVDTDAGVKEELTTEQQAAEQTEETTTEVTTDESFEVDQELVLPEDASDEQVRLFNVFTKYKEQYPEKWEAEKSTLLKQLSNAK